MVVGVQVVQDACQPRRLDPFECVRPGPKHQGSLQPEHGLGRIERHEQALEGVPLLLPSQQVDLVVATEAKHVELLPALRRGSRAR